MKSNGHRVDRGGIDKRLFLSEQRRRRRITILIFFICSSDSMAWKIQVTSQRLLDRNRHDRVPALTQLQIKVFYCSSFATIIDIYRFLSIDTHDESFQPLGDSYSDRDGLCAEQLQNHTDYHDECDVETSCGSVSERTDYTGLCDVMVGWEGYKWTQSWIVMQLLWKFNVPHSGREEEHHGIPR